MIIALFVLDELLVGRVIVRRSVLQLLFNLLAFDVVVAHNSRDPLVVFENLLSGQFLNVRKLLREVSFVLDEAISRASQAAGSSG